MSINVFINLKILIIDAKNIYNVNNSFCDIIRKNYLGLIKLLFGLK